MTDIPGRAESQGASFAPGDPVRFSYRRRLLTGTIVRLLPKRAAVRANETEYRVPYERLEADPAIAAKRQTRISKVQAWAESALETYGLRTWTFQFDHAARRAGCCNYRDRIISISFGLAATGSEADIRDTLLHEIAHALVGKKHNHDAVWKAKAREIGCSGERCHRMEIALPRWRVRCENHCWNQTAHRRNPRLVCRTCGGRLVYTPFTGVIEP